jgi:RHS repeat-associated protein
VLLAPVHNCFAHCLRPHHLRAAAIHGPRCHPPNPITHGALGHPEQAGYLALRDLLPRQSLNRHTSLQVEFAHLCLRTGVLWNRGSGPNQGCANLDVALAGNYAVALHVWSSDLDGNLGSGASVSPTLSLGNHTITASVTDALNSTVTATLNLTVFGIPNNRPQVSITAPQESQVSVGIPVTLSATSTDAEDGNLNSTLQWSSDKDGSLGSGPSLNVTLSAGMHVLTASSTDSDNATGFARTTLLVGDPTTLASYAYNALGQRVSKTDAQSETTTHFLYDPQGRLIAEIDASTGDTIREYIYVNGQQVAIVDDTDTPNEALYFVHNDHLGTPLKITDTTQQVVWAADYEPFGKADITTDAIASGKDFNIRFPGQYEDQESGLHYNYFRDYDPGTGRYVASDRIGLMGGLNTFAYGENNPLRYADPLGLAVTGEWVKKPFVHDLDVKYLGWNFDVGGWKWIPPGIRFAMLNFDGAAVISFEIRCTDDDACAEEKTWTIAPDIRIRNQFNVPVRASISHPLITAAVIAKAGYQAYEIFQHWTEIQMAYYLAINPTMYCLGSDLLGRGGE